MVHQVDQLRDALVARGCHRSVRSMPIHLGCHLALDNIRYVEHLADLSMAVTNPEALWGQPQIVSEGGEIDAGVRSIRCHHSSRAALAAKYVREYACAAVLVRLSFSDPGRDVGSHDKWPGVFPAAESLVISADEADNNHNDSDRDDLRVQEAVSIVASAESRDDITGTAGGTTLKVKGDTAYVTGSCHKCAYHVGETVMSLQQCRLSSATKEVIVYATIMGFIGALTPLVTREDPGKPEIKTEDVVRKEEEDLPETQVGMFRAGEGKWGSCIRVIDPVQNTVCCKLDLDVDEAALSCAVVQFEEAVAPCLVVGIVYGMTIRPRKVPRAAIKVYSYNEQYQLELVHTNLPMGISWIKVVGDRIFLGDMQDSVHVLKYRGADNSLYVLCDDVVPRYLTCGEVVDYRTVVMGDKFDSFYVARVPEEASEDELQDITGTAGGTTLKVKGDTAYVTGSCHKFETQCAYHVGETVMSLQRCRLSSATKEVIVYATIMGSIGALTPLVTREDVDFFQHLELHLRQEKPPLCGRDHIMFRSYYTPVKNVVDGDLCEQYLSLPPAKQEEIAAELDKVPADIIKKLEDLRNQIL
ncbi:unnamed protein product [Vitrella brassicaformis CCMP3155]|uniref:RSE1/DDB1/CPSF1 C-terminal domain-containing protein n=1 Tax=Vitrella brassicaformis (strain CCMP3155) TaxID=1169540 RepID=A0A0G4GYE2_VITBC|nr:unnamed protein product [Vitrella brassicaformis CCMP3155]|eukprot:CEM36001.1 unnamed protein product [Vitrella brassicaformis CCMP3155]